MKNPNKKNNSKNMRNAMIRISKVNILKKDNPQLGLEVGDEYIITREMVLNTLVDWSNSKSMSYFFIEHGEDEDNIHYHIVLDFDVNSQAEFKTIKNKFPYGDIGPCKHGVRACCQYLIHMNNLDKHQYDKSEIITNNRPILERNLEPVCNQNTELDRVIQKITMGVIKEYDATNLIDNTFYAKHFHKLDNAFAVYNRRQLSENKRNINIVVFQGPAGAGKSSICQIYAEQNGDHLYITSSANDMMQDYRGEEYLCIDDVNHKTISISDMLKLINPHQKTSTKGRYRNKAFVGKTIFICTNDNILDWYSSVKNSNLRDAFFRRISAVMEFEPLAENKIARYTECVIGKDEAGNRILVPVKNNAVDLKKYIDFDTAPAEDFSSILETL